MEAPGNGKNQRKSVLGAIRVVINVVILIRKRLQILSLPVLCYL